MNIVMIGYRGDLGLSDNVYNTNYDQIVIKGLDRVIDEIKAFKPDLIIEEESNDGKSIYTSLYNRLPAYPKAWWMIDAHITLAEHLNYAKQFQYVFCGQSWFIPFVQRETLASAYFLPLCHTQSDAQYRNWIVTPRDKDIPFSFIGNIRSLHVERKRYVRHFLEMFGDKFFARQTDHDTTMGYLSRSVMTFNCSLNNDLNFRVWEAIAFDCQVLTDMVSDVNKTGVGKFCTLYDKLNPDWSIMQRPVFHYGAQQFILEHHTLTCRFNQMIKMIEYGKQEEYA